MSIFEITIQAQRNPAEWPVIIKFQDQDELPIEKNGILRLSQDDLQQLSMLQHKPRDYGTFLGKALFQGELFHGFREAFTKSQKLMRVLLTVNVEESDRLKTLHWERLCAPIDESWEHLALNQRLPFSQYIPTSNLDRNYPTIDQSDLRALVIVANPENLEEYSLASFDVATTVSGLRQALGDIPCDVLAYDIEDAVGAPTLNQLCQRLSFANPPYTLLHIVCHGRVVEGKTALYLSNENNQVEPVMDQHLIQQFQHLGSKDSLPHLTFLCSCSSGSPLGRLTRSLVQKLAMPAVVAMSDQVSVKTGIALAQGFYPRLRKLGAVDIALQQAATGLAERHDITVPALFSRYRDKPLFNLIPQSPHKTAPNLAHPTNRDEPEVEYDAYISYVDEDPDSSWVWDVLLPQLEDAGLKVAVSGETDLVGVAQIVNVERGLKLSRRTLVVLSELYLANTMAEFENVMVQTMGIDEGTARLVLLEKDAINRQNLPYRLKQLSAVKLNHPRRAKREFQKLIQQLKQPLPHRTTDGVYDI